MPLGRVLPIFHSLRETIMRTNSDPKQSLISPEELATYNNDGFAYLRGAIPCDLLDQGQQIIEPWVNFHIASWREIGLINGDYIEFDFWHRLLAAWRDAGQPMFRRRPYQFLVTKEMFSFLHAPQLLQIAEHIIGTSELSVHGIFNARPQLPGASWTETPFHQDSQYWSLIYGKPEPDLERRTHVMTMWIPLQPVDTISGCLQVISKNDTGDKLFSVHDYDFETTGFMGLSPQDVALYPKIACPMNTGDLLIFNQRTPHGAAPNLSNHIRWSIDIRYEATATATVIGQRFGFIVQSNDPAKVDSFESWQARCKA